jgi:hypothetical protein
VNLFEIDTSDEAHDPMLGNYFETEADATGWHRYDGFVKPVDGPVGKVTTSGGVNALPGHGPPEWCHLTVEEHLPIGARYRLVEIVEGQE